MTTQRTAFARAPHGRWSRLIAGGAAMLMATVGLVSLPTAAVAAPGDAFDPTTPTVFVAQSPQDGSTRLYRAETTGAGDFAFTPEGDAVPSGTYNAISFNPADNFIYGAVIAEIGDIPQRALVRIGQDGAVTRVPGVQYPVGDAQWAGAFNPNNGRYYSTNGTPANSLQLHSVNVATGAMSQVTLNGDMGWTIADIEYLDGYFWAIDYNGAQPRGSVVRINPTTGAVKRFPAAIPTTLPGAWGAAWKFGNGNLGFSNNGTGAIAQLRITDGGTASPTFELVSLVPGPPSNGNDGTSIVGLPADLAVEKTAPAEFLSGGALTYSITVTNNGPGVSSGWTISDPLPAQLSDFTISDNVTSAVNGNVATISGGRLAVGDSITFQITAATNTVTPGACIENTATVLGNEADDVSGNDSDGATACAAEQDHGDAPASYGTTNADDGPRHSMPGYDADANTAPVMLGSLIDAEDDGQPGAAADGDDTAGAADEDGVVFNPALGYDTPTLRTGTDPDSLGDAQNTLEVTASADGFVSVWVDWNQDGDFADSGEQVATAQAVTAGANDVTFTRGVNPQAISTHVRVRYSTDAAAIALPVGAAPDGEVEDYRVLLERLIQPDVCYATDTEYYAFTFSDRVSATGAGEVGSASRYANAAVVNGVAVDVVIESIAGELNAPNKQPNGIGVGSGEPFGTDDAQWQVDRDATLRYSFYEAGSDIPIEINGVFTVNDMDGTETVSEIATFSAADLVRYSISEGSRVVIEEDGGDVVFRGNGNNNGDSPSRFQIVLEGTSSFEARWQGSTSSGFGFDGDGDIGVQPPACADFGDAPASYGTMLLDDGARHQITEGLTLGTAIDFDPDGQARADALGDDQNRIADEDGIADPIEVTAGGDPTTVTVSATNSTATAATLAGWIDLNGNGTFESGERALVAVPPNSGTADYVLDFPSGSPTADTFARFRLFPGAVAEPAPTGQADAGEVEDYAVTVLDRALEIEKTSDATADTRVGDTVTYTVTATNTGTGDYTATSPAVVLDDLAGVLDDADFNGDAAASIDDTAVNAPSLEGSLLGWTGALASGESVEITYSVTLTAGGDGSVRNVAFAGDCDPASAECEPVTPACTDDVPTCDEELFELPRLTIEKTANRAELPAVGESVEFTITVTNEGPGDYTADAPATFTDDLSDILDSATYNDDADASTGDVSYEDPTLSWSGALVSGDSVTVTYTATYTGGGDQNLQNTACVPASEVLPGAAPCDFVRVPGSGLTTWKQVLSSDTPAVAGSVLTYTLFFANDGEAAATVDSIDDLTHVLDDADVTIEPTSADGLSVSRDDERIAITGTVPSGETFAVTYQVTLRADGDRGDDLAANFLLANDPDNPPVPPTDPVCEPTDEQFPDCTVTPIAALTYSKAVVASAAPIAEGTVLSYTITVHNTGTATGPVSREDVLAGVLDDADLTSEPASDTDSVSVTDVTDGRFRMGGALAAGETALVTYEVTVRAQDDRGDSQADNFLVNPGGTPPAECAEGSTECTSTPMPVIAASKTVTPESGSTVVAGQSVTYTLTFGNSGGAPGAVEYTDHLGDVLDDATLDGLPATSDPALTAELATADTLSIEGILAAGQTVTVSYVVTVLADGERADNRIGNVLAPSDVEDPECGDAGVSCTENPIPLLDAWKTVEADSSPVAAGTVLTYSLHFENTGEAAADVDHIDDLTHVSDDADVTAEPVSDDLTVTRDGNRIGITGSVPAGETYTVTYQVTLRGDDERGDDIAANFLMANDPDDPPTPPADPVCQPSDSERPDCTVTPIGRLLTSKAVSADATPVVAGTVLTYTLTFDNQGEGPVVIDHRDHLSDVLDDATVTTAPAASDDALDVSAVADDAFTVTGELAAGQTETVTYRVTVNAEGERGNNTANNFLVPGDEDPPATCAESDPNCTVTPLPLIESAKSSDPATGSDVQAGQEVTYTLTFTNSGQADGPVAHTDHLAGVLDDAVLTAAPVSDDAALVVTSGADGEVNITGTLSPEQTVTVTYTVTVRADGERGDNRLGNVLAPSGLSDPDCDDAGVSCTEHFVGELDDWKTVDPASGSSVQAGSEVTYTLHFENTGTAAVAVDRDDVLTEVLDDATVSEAPVSSDGALSVSEVVDGRLTVTGSLEPGEYVTVTYVVTVNADGERGDDRLGNFLVPAGGTPPTECVPADQERPDCTVNHVSSVVASKSADPASGTEVAEGRAVTYTLTFRNVSQNTASAPADLAYTDHMADVLDDATFSAGPAVSLDGVTAARDGDTIRVAGALEAGEVVTVTYTVTVNAWADQGDHRLGNVVAVTGEAPVCAPDSTLCTTHDLVKSPPLALTGGGIVWIAVWSALVLLIGGAGALVIARRRRTSAPEDAERLS